MKPLSKESRKKYESWMIRIGEALRRVRKARPMSQTEAAKTIGLSAVHLCNIESGKSIPSPRVLFSLCEMYEVAPGILYILAENPDSAFFMDEVKRYAEAEIRIPRARKAKP